MSTRLDPTIRMSRRFLPDSEPKRDGGQPEAGPSGLEPRQILLLAAWFGVVTGLLELLQLAVRNQLSGSVWLGVLRMNRHFGWMIPVSNVVIFLAAGLVGGVIARHAPRAGRWMAIRVLGFLCSLALLSTVRGLHPIATFSLSAAIGHVLARIAEARPSLARRAIARSLPTLLLVDIGLAVACSASPSSGNRDSTAAAVAMTGGNRPNVLLIVLDTVRAESLSVHGYGRDTAPNLARLADRGVLFEQARATAPWTFPSHATMFTGRWPHELKVGENRPLDSSFPTIAERLSALGYRTGGFVANTFFCNSWYGLGRGFDRYEDFYDDDVAVSWIETLRCASLGQRLLDVVGVSTADHRVRKDAARVNRDFLDWLDRNHGQPYFAFLNYFDAHSPYLLPQGEKRRLGTPEPDEAGLAILRTWEERPKQNVSDHETRLVRDAYDECIAYLDEQLGRLFEQLDRRGSLDNTLVILTSDHGEELGEHGLYGHGKSLYGQETHVPLIVVPPRRNGSRLRVDVPVSLRDIPATILDVLAASDRTPFPGTSLAGHWTERPASAAASSPAFSEVSLRLGASRNPNRPPAWRGPMQAVVADRRSYIRNADGSEQLHDLHADPREERSLADAPAERDVLVRLRTLLNSILMPKPAPG